MRRGLEYIRLYRDNTSASVAIAQIQDGSWTTVWPFEFASSEIVYPAPLK
ncbi:MAG: hypothetical protein PUI34_01920 [Hornefia butyriciproducens]|nr:hypothetical protein [Hornefia butyriciproducens]